MPVLVSSTPYRTLYVPRTDAIVAPMTSVAGSGEEFRDDERRRIGLPRNDTTKNHRECRSTKTGRDARNDRC